MRTPMARLLFVNLLDSFQVGYLPIGEAIDCMGAPLERR